MNLKSRFFSIVSKKSVKAILIRITENSAQENIVTTRVILKIEFSFFKNSTLVWVVFKILIHNFFSNFLNILYFFNNFTLLMKLSNALMLKGLQNIDNTLTLIFTSAFKSNLYSIYKVLYLRKFSYVYGTVITIILSYFSKNLSDFFNLMVFCTFSSYD